jgi:hypothetical protein
MHPLIHVKKGTPVLLVALVLVCFPLLPSGQALLPPPPPGGGYPNGNTAEGTFGLFNLTSGIYNTANGFNTLANNTTGSYNTAAGFKALAFNTTGNYNTANGFEALTFNTTGSYNTANGQQALFSNATGEQNTATGTFALLSNQSANNNTADGSKPFSSIPATKIRPPVHLRSIITRLPTTTPQTVSKRCLTTAAARKILRSVRVH